MIPAKEIEGELWIKAADLPTCPNCEYHKQRAQIWRDEVYKLTGHPLPERKKEWVELTHGEVEDIYEAVMKADVAELVDNFARALEIKLKEKNT